MSTDEGALAKMTDLAMSSVITAYWVAKWSSMENNGSHSCRILDCRCTPFWPFRTRSGRSLGCGTSALRFEICVHQGAGCTRPCVCVVTTAVETVPQRGLSVVVGWCQSGTGLHCAYTFDIVLLEWTFVVQAVSCSGSSSVSRWICLVFCLATVSLNQH